MAGPKQLERIGVAPKAVHDCCHHSRASISEWRYSTSYREDGINWGIWGTLSSSVLIFSHSIAFSTAGNPYISLSAPDQQFPVPTDNRSPPARTCSMHAYSSSTLRLSKIDHGYYYYITGLQRRRMSSPHYINSHATLSR